MDNPSKYLECFYIWDYIGGRFSSTSMVGGVTLALSLGIENFKKILQGANQMDKTALLTDPFKNLPLLGALIGIWNRNFLHIPTLAVIPYSQALHFLPYHLQQCDMESNGKSLTKTGEFARFKTGPIIFGDVGTDAQHSFFQYLHQGSENIAVEFIGFKRSQFNFDPIVNNTTSQEKLLANLFGQALSLAKGKLDSNPNRLFLGNKPSHILLANRLDPVKMGALLAYYEHKIAFQGFIWNINSFDQEGVQLGKKLATTISDLFKEKKKEKPSDNEVEHAYIKLLDKIL